MTIPLPIVQSIPHGGMEAPTRFRDRLAIDATDFYNEADLWADALYDFSQAATPCATLARVTTPIARGIVDVNRPPDDLQNQDGAVKAISSYGRATFAPPLTDAEKTALIDECWRPWHDALAAALVAASGTARLLLDCHTMAQRGPSAYAHPGAARPAICIANLGDTNGDPRTKGKLRGAVTAPAWFVRKAGEIAAELFADLSMLEPDEEAPPVVAINWPFPGGYIIKRYTALANETAAIPDWNPDVQAPWSLMVEINRGLYVGNQTARTPIAPPNLERIAAVRDRLAAWAQALCTLVPS